jgi:6-pyruvoyltetrahydropterin/6-carboxytetrahydropterin synthase
MFEISVKSHFDAAHRLVGYPGKCNRLHGHRWDVEITLVGEELDGMNMLVDFKEIKDVMNDQLEAFDHFYLNDLLNTIRPTAEFLAKYMYDQLAGMWTTVGLQKVTIWESPECKVSYYGEA